LDLECRWQRACCAFAGTGELIRNFKKIKVSKEALLFLKKKKQKDFHSLSGPLSGGGRQPIKRFLLLFFKKEALA
jgi:hypothetical protein